MIFVKFPEPGKVKTRLAQALGDAEAAAVYRQLVARVLQQVGCPDPDKPALGWERWIIFDPRDREADVQAWLAPLLGGGAAHFLPQVDGDLGVRLAAAFAAGFAAGFDKVAAIGTDCVELGQAEIVGCWQALDENEVVFGPAADGGYYLIGLNEDRPELFADIPWSSAHTLEASQLAAARAGLRCGELAVLTDIDEIAQWEALCRADAGQRSG